MIKGSGDEVEVNLNTDTSVVDIGTGVLSGFSYRIFLIFESS